MRVLETCLYVDDLALAERFYVDVLGLRVQGRVEGRHLFLYADGAMLLLFDPAVSRLPGSLPPHEGRAGGHVCFACEQEDLAGWEARLTDAGRHVTRYRWGERGDSLYFHDPAGNLLEFAPPRIWGLDVH